MLDWPEMRRLLSTVGPAVLVLLGLAAAVGIATGVRERGALTQTVLQVTSTEDTEDVEWGDGLCGDTLGRCTLRGAIQEANTHEGADAIKFRIATGPKVIKPKTAFPVIVDNTTLDATTQPGYAGTPLIHIDGSDAGEGADGLVLAGDKGVVRGVAVTDFGGIGVVIADNEESSLQASYVGVRPDGVTPGGNGGHGVQLLRTRGAIIGGTAVADRNVISANRGNGVYIVEVGARRNRVIGNFIGTDATGNAALPNRVDGISIENAQYNEIGGQEAGAVNLISGNLDDGVEIVGPGAISNTVRSNWIGTTRDGSAAVGNGDAGVLVGTATESLIIGNVVAGNSGIGIEVSGGARRNQVMGNYVGSNPSIGEGLANRGAGIAVLDAADNVVGAIGSPNRVVGNSGPGILVAGNRALGNQLVGNEVGRVGGANRPNGGFGMVVRDGASGNRLDQNRAADGIRVWGAGTDRNIVANNDVPVNFERRTDWDALEVGHGARGTHLEGNQITGSGRNGLAVVGAGTDDTVVAANVVTGSQAAGLLVGPEVGSVDIFPSDGRANRFLSNYGAGVEIHGFGHELGNAVVTGNGLGIALFGRYNIVVDVTVQDNRAAGISVLEGQGHGIWHSRIDRNGGLGIDLGGDGVTPNDPLDADDGPNGLVNAPEVVWAVMTGSRTEGGDTANALIHYDGAPSAVVTIEVYAVPACDPSGYGEGADTVGVGGEVDVVTDAQGHAADRLEALDIPRGSGGLTATAEVFGAGTGTSEFSACTTIARGRALLPWAVR